MSFTVTIRGDIGAPILAEYACPEHGVFEQMVERPSPDDMPCPKCGGQSPWTITVAPMGKVRAVEVERGGWQKPEHKTWLDTRELGEGMPIEEWRAKRAAIRDEQRRKDISELLKS